MTFDKTKSAGYLANHMARLFAQRLHEQIKPLGIAPAQFMVLLELWSEEGLTQRELVQRMSVEQATMANTLRRMERDGLIVRRLHPHDKRASTIVLTDKAHALRDDATKAASLVNARALEGIPQKDCENFVQTARSIIAALR